MNLKFLLFRRITLEYSGICAVFLFLTLFCGCNQSDPVKIGFIGTLSGNSSELGVYQRNSVRLAVTEVNRMGGLNGRDVELYIADDKGNPSDGLKAAEELVSKGVIAVIGHSTTGPQALSMPFFEKNNILMISPSVTTSSLSGKDDNYIKLAGSNNHQAATLADYAVRDLKLRSFAVIYDINNKGYAEGIANHFTGSLHSLGGSVVFRTTYHSSDYNKLSAIIDTLKQLKPEGVFLSASGMDNAVFCQLMRKKKMNLPVFTGIWSTTDDLLNYGGKAVERIYTVNSFNWEDSSGRYSLFKKQYEKMYRQMPSFSAAYGYEAAQILLGAIANAKSLDYHEIKKQITGRMFPGLQQDFYIDRSGDVERKLNILKIQNGRFIRVK